MKWKKLGQVFEFKKINEDLVSHASNPLAIPLEKDIFRVFFSGRNIDNKSSVSFVDIDIERLKLVMVSQKTIFKYGEADSFYSHGVSIGNCYKRNNKDYILFMGWQIKNDSHWRGDIGCLCLENNEKLHLEPNEAFMSSDEEDPISLSYPWVMFDEGIYKMWYGSTISWTSENGEMIHAIKYASSRDGENWEKHGVAIPYEIGVAQAFSRPSVLKNEQGYHMWYSFRSGNGTSYRIGYAHSFDGISWLRKDEEPGIGISDSGWDSEMVCYPFVFEHKEKRYMLYNGNSYGKTGFGIAVLEKK